MLPLSPSRYPPDPPQNAGFWGGSCFLLYFHFFLTKSFRRKYRILQIFWRMSEKSMEVISSVRELKFCFFWKNGAFFQDFSHFWILKIKFWKNNVTLLHVSIMISDGFQKMIYWIKSREYFKFLKYVVVFEFSQHLLTKFILWLLP